MQGGNVNFGSLVDKSSINIYGDIVASDDITCDTAFVNIVDAQSLAVRGDAVIENNLTVDGNMDVAHSKLYTSNQYTRGIGKTKLYNANSIDKYALLIQLLKLLTKQVVFEPNNTGAIITKELISNTTINYAYTDYMNGIYAGHIQNSTGRLYFYDQDTATETSGVSVSFYCNMLHLLQPTESYQSCVIFSIDQFPINIFNNQRRKIKVLFMSQRMYSNGNPAGYNYKISVMYYDNDAPYSEVSHIMDTTDGLSSSSVFITSRFYSFNFTRNSVEIFINGVMVKTQTVSLPSQYEFQLEKFYFPQEPNPSNPNEYQYNQEYSFWNVFLHYNRTNKA